MSYYANKIHSLLGCSLDDAAMIEDIMRNDVLHTVALDWLSEQEFNAAVRKASRLLEQNRADYEAYYAGTRAIFKQMQAAQAKRA